MTENVEEKTEQDREAILSERRRLFMARAEDQGKLADAVIYLDEKVARLRSELNARGDDSCWFDPNLTKLPPLKEFLVSCIRHHTQVSGEMGVLDGCMTIAQLEERSREVSTLNTRVGQLKKALFPFAELPTVGPDDGHDLDDEHSQLVTNRMILDARRAFEGME